MRCLLIEDEPLAREVIEGYISDVQEITLVQSFANAVAARNYINEHPNSFDFLILDVHMPKISGTDFLKTLSQQPPVIFVTAYSEYAVESYDYNTVDYLTKPVAFPRFLKAVERLKERGLTKGKEAVNASPTFLFVKEKDAHVKVMFEDILWVEGMGDYIKIELDKKHYVHHSSMKAFFELLPEYFLRVHQSYIVNGNKMAAVKGNRIRVGEEEIPIGRTYKEKLQAFLKI